MVKPAHYPKMSAYCESSFVIENFSRGSLWRVNRSTCYVPAIPPKLAGTCYLELVSPEGEGRHFTWRLKLGEILLLLDWRYGPYLDRPKILLVDFLYGEKVYKNTLFYLHEVGTWYNYLNKVHLPCHD